MEQMTLADLKDLIKGLDDETEVRFVKRANTPKEIVVDSESSKTVGGVLYLVEGGTYGDMPAGVEEEIDW